MDTILAICLFHHASHSRSDVQRGAPSSSPSTSSSGSIPTRSSNERLKSRTIISLLDAVTRHASAMTVSGCLGEYRIAHASVVRRLTASTSSLRTSRACRGDIFTTRLSGSSTRLQRVQRGFGVVELTGIL